MSERANEKERYLAALTPPSADRGTGFTDAPDDDGVGARNLPAPDDEGVSARRFVPGYVFANRYRMITRIGHGGMGEV